MKITVVVPSRRLAGDVERRRLGLQVRIDHEYVEDAVELPAIGYGIPARVASRVLRRRHNSVQVGSRCGVIWGLRKRSARERDRRTATPSAALT